MPPQRYRQPAKAAPTRSTRRRRKRRLPAAQRPVASSRALQRGGIKAVRAMEMRQQAQIATCIQRNPLFGQDFCAGTADKAAVTGEEGIDDSLVLLDQRTARGVHQTTSGLE